MDKNATYLEPSLEKQLKGHRNGITALYFNPNGQQIASSSLDNSVLLWDLRGTMRSYRFQGHDEAVMDVTFSPSGKYMASASRDKTVRIWVPTVTGSTGMFKAHSQTVRSVQFSTDGSKIITASDDKIVKLWSTDKYKFIASFVGHTNWVRCARISCDSSVIASCSDDKSTRLWSPDSGENIHTYKDKKGHGLCVAWHPSGCYIAVGTSEGNVKLYDVRTHNLVQYYSIHNDAVTQLAFHPSGSYIITSSKDGKLKILDLLEGHPIFTLGGHTGSVNTVNFSHSGDSFASAGDDKLVFIWKTNFTELASETKENKGTNTLTKPITNSTPQSSKLTSKTGRNQGSKAWYKCYHNTRVPITTFVHLDDINESALEQSFTLETLVEETNAGTVEENRETLHSDNDSSIRHVPAYNQSTPRNNKNLTSDMQQNDLNGSSSSLDSVGDISHIPRIPPNPTTYTVPSIMNKSADQTHQSQENLFGMIKLKDNDVCYTSGTIEWIGRKRSYPINSGFKVITEDSTDKHLLKMRKLNETFSQVEEKPKACDCADILPTVNAIVDHLNALHEAVDIVDLRLNTVEDIVSNN